MASLDHRLNPLFSIKECMSCGALYTRNCGCSKGGLEDKILVPKPPQNCATCGNPVDGLYCRSCAFMRRCLNEGWYTIHDENEILNTSKSSKNNTNVNNAYQYIGEAPQEFSQCSSDMHLCIDENSKPNSSNDFPSVLTHPPQLQFETYLCELCGNNAHYGYDCPPQFPLAFLKEYDHIPPNEKCMALLLAEERFLKIKQTMKEEQNQPEVMQELLLKLMDDLQSLKGSQQEKKETAAQSLIPYWNSSMIDDEEARDNFLKDVCTFLRKFSRIPFGVTPKVILIAWESFGEIKDALTDKQNRQEDIQELMSKLLEDVRNISEEFSEYINCPSWNRPLFYFDDDDDEYTVIWRRPKAISPDEPSEEPEDPLIMGEKELSTIPEKDKSSVEDLDPIPSGSKDVSDDICDNDHSDAESLLSQDIPITSSKIDFLSEDFAGEFAPIPPGMDEDEFDEEEVDHDISSDDNSYENIEYVEASPLNLEYDSLEEENEDQEEKEFDLEDIFQIQDVILREKLLNVHRLITNIESLKNNPTPDFVFKSPSSFPIPVMDSDSFFEESDTSLSHSDNSLPEFETFSDHTEETRSGRGLTSVVISDNSNDPLLELPEFESFHFDLDPSFTRPPPEPPDVEISLIIETDALVINNFDELNEDECFDPGGGEINVEVDNSFTFDKPNFSEDSRVRCFVPDTQSLSLGNSSIRDQDFDSSDDEGNAYFGEALVVVGNDEMTELVMDSSGSYHMTHRKDFLYDFKVIDGGSVQLGDNRTYTIKGTGKVKIQLHDGSSFILKNVRYVQGLRRSLILLGTLEKEGYTMKIQIGRIKVIKGCWVMLTGIKKKNCMYTLEAKVMTFVVQKHEGSKQVGLKQLGSKQVGFKQLGHKQVGFKQLGPGVKKGVHGVQVEKRVCCSKMVEGQATCRINKHGLLGKGAGKGTPWYKVGANIMVTGVPSQEGAEGNVAEKKKVKESMEANLGKLLKYNDWSTRFQLELQWLVPPGAEASTMVSFVGSSTTGSGAGGDGSTSCVTSGAFSTFSGKEQRARIHHLLSSKATSVEDLKSVNPSIDDPPELELKDLPSHLEYAFLEGTDKLPVIIAKDLKEDEKVRLPKVLKSHKRAIA
ncbi:hypothetical protein Tco_0172670 [Tanacetum coccineum]